MQQVTIALKSNAGLDELAVTLDVDVFVGVDQDVGNRWILQQRLKRPQPKHLVQNFLGETVSFRQAYRQMILTKEPLQNRLHLAAQFLTALGLDGIHVEHAQEFLMDAGLQIRITLPAVGERRFFSHRTGIVTRLLETPPMMRLTETLFDALNAAGTITVT